MKGWWCMRFGDALAWVEAPSEAATVRRSLSLPWGTGRMTRAISSSSPRTRTRTTPTPTTTPGRCSVPVPLRVVVLHPEARQEPEHLDCPRASRGPVPSAVVAVDIRLGDSLHGGEGCH